MNQSIGEDGKKANNEEPFSYLFKLQMNVIKQTVQCHSLHITGVQGLFQ